jgi:hypothetical protein
LPSVKLELGRFVTVRGPRADGTYRVLFEIPTRLRPSGWLPTTPLPRSGERKGDLADAAEVGRIQADAAALYQAYLAARAGRDAPAEADARTVRTLIATWERSEDYRKTKPKTKKGYAYLAREIQAWSDAHAKAPDPTHMRKPDVEAFLRLYDDRPTQKWQVRKVLRMVMQQAVDLGWREDNPVAGVKVDMPETRVDIWEAADVEAHVWAAVFAGQPWVGAMILAGWEIGQRLTDVILFRRGAEYEPAEGVFRFRQSKTKATVAIPVSDRLRGVLEACKVDGSPYLFLDGATKRPFRDVDRLGHVFEEVRAPVVANGGRHLLLRALRHSCVVQLARAGCAVPEIASITGHSIDTVGKMLGTYLPRDSAVARNAQQKRGLIA